MLAARAAPELCQRLPEEEPSGERAQGVPAAPSLVRITTNGIL
jgi:hypothetical protein